MGRPSCCHQPSGEGAGVVAVAVIIGAAFIAAKIGPSVARIWHIVVEALTVFMLTAASVAVVVFVTWATARFIGSRRAYRQVLPRPVPSAAQQQYAVQTGGEPGCLACGGTGTVLRAITGSHYQADRCPVCDPAERAG